MKKDKKNLEPVN